MKFSGHRKFAKNFLVKRKENLKTLDYALKIVVSEYKTANKERRKMRNPLLK